MGCFRRVIPGGMNGRFSGFWGWMPRSRDRDMGVGLPFVDDRRLWWAGGVASSYPRRRLAAALRMWDWRASPPAAHFRFGRAARQDVRGDAGLMKGPSRIERGGCPSSRPGWGLHCGRKDEIRREQRKAKFRSSSRRRTSSGLRQRESQASRRHWGTTGGGRGAVYTPVLHRPVSIPTRRRGRGCGAIEGSCGRLPVPTASMQSPSAFHPVGAVARGNAHGVGKFQRGFLSCGPIKSSPPGLSHAAIHDVRKACGSHIRRRVRNAAARASECG